jgi:uncharacterized membrane protein
MDSGLALFTGEGFAFVMRWLHFFFGITWIGHLYYFNFTQGPFFNETDAATKSNAIQKLVPRALWWFRWGAVWTLATGLVILWWRSRGIGHEIFLNPWGLKIAVGSLLGIVMAANVWFIIWPNQKIVIASATQAATGGQPLPNAAAAGAKAGLASRHNVLFSIPMLFFMGAASFLPIQIADDANFVVFYGVLVAAIAGIEFNAIKGKMGPLTTIKGVITSGFVLTMLLYFLVEFAL